MAQNAAVAAVRFVALDLVGDALAFPVWWYTAGFLKFLGWLGVQARAQWHTIGLGVWLKNLFVPMFGQTDVWGRIISFFIRLGQIIGRGIWYLATLLLIVVAAVLWVAFPPVLVTLLVFQFAALAAPSP